MTNPTTIRRKNAQAIFETILSHGVCTTRKIKENTDLSLATISRITAQLRQKDLIEQEQKPTTEPGRKPELFRINRQYGCSLYFNLRSGCLEGFLVDFGGTVLRSANMPVSPELTPKQLPGQAEKLASSLLDGSDTLLAVCLSLPGQQDRQSGCVCRIPNFPDFENAPVQKLMEQRFHVPCLIQNTARLTAWGHFLARKDIRNLVFLEITEDCGIGAGLVLNGSLYEDRDGLAGEVGDMIVRPDEKAAPLHCGGALEAHSGMKMLLAKAGCATLRELEQKAREDSAAHSILSDAIHAWSAAIVNLTAVLSPDVIVVGGGITEENTLCSALIGAYLKKLYYRPIPLEFVKAVSQCHAVGGSDLLCRFLYRQELDKITE